MEEDDPVAKQVLHSLKKYLCRNLPNDETFIIQLGNAGLINKDKAPWLGALARTKDPSCISNLIESMCDYFDESMLSNFCTFLDKYAKDARPQMRNVAAKIREKIEFIGKANEPKDPGSKRSQPPSDDQQPPPKRPHSAQEEQRPAVGVGDEPGALKNVRFAIITANENEWESANFFMGIGKCITKGHLEKYLTDNFSDLFEADPDKITVEFVKSIDTYYLVRVGGVLGVLTECFKMGSLGAGESFDTVKKLLDTASEKEWELEAVFLVGCCGCASQETDVLGTVLVADKIYPYEGGEFNKEGYTQQHEPITMAEDWVYRLEFRNNETAKISAALKVQKLSRASFFSGCKMKDKNQAEKLQKKIQARFLGFEMEGVGAYLPVKKSKASKTDILVVKGVSDQGDRYKNEPAPITFFSKELQNVDEDTRQQMCTMMSLMVVFRAIKAKWGEN